MEEQEVFRDKMTYKFGTYSFPSGDEPERWDYTVGNLSDGDHSPFEPFNYLDNLGLGVGSLSLQGYTITLANYDSLMGQYKTGSEIVAQVQEWDGTERQFFGIAGGQSKEQRVGQRKGVYDYILSLACPDPFKYDTALQYEAYAAVDNTPDVSFSVTTGQVGSAVGYPMFIINNDSGGPIANLIFYAGDGGTSITGGRIQVSLGTVADDTRVVIVPIFYENGRDVYVLRVAYNTGTSAITLASDDIRIMDSTDWKPVGTAQYTWPELTPGATTTVKCKTNSTTAVKVGMQWRKAY